MNTWVLKGLKRAAEVADENEDIYMSNFMTGTQEHKSKIHYIELINDEPDVISECGVSGPFIPIKITYQHRYEGLVCKKCFKSYISSLTVPVE